MILELTGADESTVAESSSSWRNYHPRQQEYGLPSSHTVPSSIRPTGTAIGDDNGTHTTIPEDEDSTTTLSTVTFIPQALEELVRDPSLNGDELLETLRMVSENLITYQQQQFQSFHSTTDSNDNNPHPHRLFSENTALTQSRDPPAAFSANIAMSTRVQQSPSIRRPDPPANVMDMILQDAVEKLTDGHRDASQWDMEVLGRCAPRHDEENESEDSKPSARPGAIRMTRRPLRQQDDPPFPSASSQISGWQSARRVEEEAEAMKRFHLKWNRTRRQVQQLLMENNEDDRLFEKESSASRHPENPIIGSQTQVDHLPTAFPVLPLHGVSSDQQPLTSFRRPHRTVLTTQSHHHTSVTPIVVQGQVIAAEDDGIAECDGEEEKTDARAWTIPTASTLWCLGVAFALGVAIGIGGNRTTWRSR